MSHLTRRRFIGAAAGLGVIGDGLTLPARGVSINPRSAWAVDRPPKGPLHGEDVRFLIVHHSASRNGHSSADAPAILRSFYDYHTSSEKGWNDIAYNFLIDADGGIWEGRSGSLAGAVAGDATGGNQGFSQLVCIIGDYNTATPSATSLTSLVWLLAWLADRHGVPTSPGSEVTFTSRGSNKHPAGTNVTTSTITGHDTMSRTTCPGTNLNAYVAGALMGDVHALRGGGALTTPSPGSSSTSSPSTSTPTTAATRPPSSTITEMTTTTTLSRSTTVPPSTTTTFTATTSLPAPPTTVPVAVEDGPTIVSRLPAVILTSVGVFVATGAGVILWRFRRMNNL